MIQFIEGFTIRPASPKVSWNSQVGSSHFETMSECCCTLQALLSIYGHFALLYQSKLVAKSNEQVFIFLQSCFLGGSERESHFLYLIVLGILKVSKEIRRPLQIGLANIKCCQQLLRFILKSLSVTDSIKDGVYTKTSCQLEGKQFYHEKSNKFVATTHGP